MPFQLVTRSSPTPRTYPLDDGASVTIGRAPDCTIVVEDQAASRRHCAIQVSGDLVTVTDLHSANGTFVNERAVSSARLRSGDLLRVGTSVFECRVVPAAGTGAFMVAGDDDALQSVVSRCIDPGQLTWLGTVEAPSHELALLRRAQQHLATLHAVSEQLAEAREIAGLCRKILRAALDLTGADRGAVLVVPVGGSADAVDVVASEVRHDGVQMPFAVSRTIVKGVIEQGLSTFAYDAAADARYREGPSVILQGIRSVMCVPLRTSEQILGALYVDTLSGPGRFTEADLELLAAVGNQAGVALHRVRLLGELERLLLDTIRAIAATVDAKDGYTHRHSERVAGMARRLAAQVGLSEADQESVEFAGLLHDLGKIAVPDSILNKPGRLSPEEFEVMKQHPVHGARILANIQSPAIATLIPGVRHHHERWDGTGYPDGLKGDAIPVSARLLGAADFLDALTSARSYRPARSLAATLQMLREASGRHFDPAVVEAVFAVYARGEL